MAEPKPKQPKENKGKDGQHKEKEKKGVIVQDPEYFGQRIKVWDQLFEKQKAEIAAKPHVPIKVTLPNGSVKEGVSWQSTPFDIAKSISKGLAEAAVIAKVDGQLYDLGRVLEGDCTLELFKFDSEEGKKVFWHSSAHVLGQALEKLYHCSLCIGPALNEGFYYDLGQTNRPVSTEDYETLQKIVDDVVKQKQPFERLSIPKNDALEMFKYNKYKVEIISNKVPDGEYCSVYRCGPLIDLCRGPHLPNTGKIKAFKVTKNSSAYWLGDAKNDELQRVYGISFPETKQYEEWEELQRQAALRDHRVVGKAQELYFFHQLSPGSCFFLPHGARVYNKLMTLIRSEYIKRGFEEVVTPNVYNSALWEKSGHWEHYKDNMFSFDCDKQTFALKPMNCPGHCLMFQHRTRSYKELPIRFADFGVLHRNELAGALTGLTRVRRFQQDDAHIFCTSSMIKSEINSCLDFLQHIYGIFGFEFSLELSTRPEKHLGKPEVWDHAENALAEALNAFGKPWKLNPGDGAFYGPKIDIHISDALKRSHQCATIQLDFNLPERFGLEFQSETGDYERPVIIHRAILGSVERMMAILIEHTAGKWPFWLSPRQCMILPVSEKFAEYAGEVQKKIHAAGFFVDVDMTDKKLQKKIPLAQLAQYNYILVVGQQEVETHTVNVRTRDNIVHGTQSVDSLIEEFKKLEAESK
eukprot:TRINITY_DN1247_c0_g1_i1.p1 TRINITY_DN1247_c0_g1~~TRINITY_DN1247_c0_g1_i1.p1  ORF type:complete len:718 (+),score=257.49 TRINITY_DN1247_c0_g1_i1:75-2156(+)